jgi:hypothetical protein
LILEPEPPDQNQNIAVPVAAERREVVERTADCHPSVEGDVVGHVRKPGLDGHFISRRIEAEHPRLSARRPEQVEQALDGRRLAGAVSPEEPVASDAAAAFT